MMSNRALANGANDDCSNTWRVGFESESRDWRVRKYLTQMSDSNWNKKGGESYSMAAFMCLFTNTSGLLFPCFSSWSTEHRLFSCRVRIAGSAPYLSNVLTIWVLCLRLLFDTVNSNKSVPESAISFTVDFPVANRSSTVSGLSDAMANSSCGR